AQPDLEISPDLLNKIADKHNINRASRDWSVLQEIIFGEIGKGGMSREAKQQSNKTIDKLQKEAVSIVKKVILDKRQRYFWSITGKDLANIVEAVLAISSNLDEIEMNTKVVKEGIRELYDNLRVYHRSTTYQQGTKKENWLETYRAKKLTMRGLFSFLPKLAEICETTERFRKALDIEAQLSRLVSKGVIYDEYLVGGYPTSCPDEEPDSDHLEYAMKVSVDSVFREILLRIRSKARLQEFIDVVGEVVNKLPYRIQDKINHIIEDLDNNSKQEILDRLATRVPMRASSSMGDYEEFFSFFRIQNEESKQIPIHNLLNALEEKKMPTEYMANNVIPVLKELLKDNPEWFKFSIDLGIKLTNRGIYPCSTLEYGIPLAAQISADYNEFVANLDSLEKLAIELSRSDINPFKTLKVFKEEKILGYYLIDLVKSHKDFELALDIAKEFVDLSKKIENNYLDGVNLEKGKIKVGTTTIMILKSNLALIRDKLRKIQSLVEIEIKKKKGRIKKKRISISSGSQGIIYGDEDAVVRGVAKEELPQGAKILSFRYLGYVDMPCNLTYANYEVTYEISPGLRDSARFSNSVAIVIPTLNAEKAIAKVISEIPHKELEDKGYEIAVYIVDGLSTDKTIEVAQREGAEVILEKRRGKAIAMKTAFEQLKDKYDYFIMLDADATYPPKYIPQILEGLQRDDVVIGSRLKGTIEPGAMSNLHKIGNKIITWTGNILYGQRVSDICTGYWGFRKEVIQNLNIDSQKFALEVNLFTQAVKGGYKIGEIPIEYRKGLAASTLKSTDFLNIISYLISRRLSWMVDGFKEKLELTKVRRITKRLHNSPAEVSDDELKVMLAALREHLRGLKLEIEESRIEEVLKGIREDVENVKKNKDYRTKYLRKMRGEWAPIVDEKDKIVEVTEIGLAHIFGLRHRTANAFVMTPQGKIILQRRAPGRAYELYLSIFGEHIKYPESYEEGIKDELEDELKLAAEPRGKLEEWGKELYDLPGDMNREWRMLYSYNLIDKEYKKVLKESKKLEEQKVNNTEKEFGNWLAEQAKEKTGFGEVWGYYEIDPEELLNAPKEKHYVKELKKEVELHYLILTDTFKDGKKVTKAYFTPDLLERIVRDEEIMERLEEKSAVKEELKSKDIASRLATAKEISQSVRNAVNEILTLLKAQPDLEISPDLLNKIADKHNINRASRDWSVLQEIIF
ncbi:MAG: glycosyltransferase, partial [Candidatus Omnitrophica bacterium]|nr:glycosyltransferase [Candidatus Omnitrophota bacterium]